MEPTAGDDIDMTDGTEFNDILALALFEEAEGDEGYVDAVWQATKGHKCIALSYYFPSVDTNVLQMGLPQAQGCLNAS